MITLHQASITGDCKASSHAPGMKSNFPEHMKSMQCVLPYDKRSFDCTQSPKKKVGR